MVWSYLIRIVGPVFHCGVSATLAKEHSKIFLQQNDAPHSTWNVGKSLSALFHDRYIIPRGPIIWSPGLPDDSNDARRNPELVFKNINNQHFR